MHLFSFNTIIYELFRGQESTGIVTSEGNNEFNIQKGMGLVKNVFTNENIAQLTGIMGIGHTR